MPATASKKLVYVFIHGFLGSSDDWQECQVYFKNQIVICLDLPAHGANKNILVNDFCESGKWLAQEIKNKLRRLNLDENNPICIVGYSLGARILMTSITKRALNDLNIKSVFIESGNWGLQSDNEKELRWQNDSYWAQRLINEPFEKVVFDWYAKASQTVFLSLTTLQKQKLVNKRVAVNANGVSLAKTLLATSLAKQKYLVDELNNNKIHLNFICGEKDQKFLSIYQSQKSRINLSVINNAGHNCHFEQAKQFSELILSKLS